MKKDTFTVLLADAHPIARVGMRQRLEQEGIKILAEVDSGEQACRQYESCQPDVLLMDIHMPGIGGFETVRRIRTLDPEAKILIFSQADSPALFTQAISLGVNGYLTKRAATSELVEAVFQVAKHQHYYDQALGAWLCTQPEGGQPCALASLTPREFEVFSLLAQGHTVNGVADILSISPKTAGVHHTRVMNKLDIRSSTQLVRLAYQNGVISL